MSISSVNISRRPQTIENNEHTGITIDQLDNTLVSNIHVYI